MSTLQEQTKPILLPIILGKPSTLTRKAQLTLAAWIAMFAMAAEFLDKTGTRIAISAQDRLFLKTNKMPPPSMKIWIGYYERRDWVGVWTHTKVPIGSENHVPERSSLGVDFPNTQSTTIVIGRVFIHVLSSDVASIVRKAEMTGARRKLLYRIHPIKKSPLSWLPVLKLSDQDADAIAGALSERSKQIPFG
jgi:hypothetical protein